MSDQSRIKPYKNKDNVSFGIILIVLGSFFMLDRLDMINARDYYQYWPGLIALAGVICVVRAQQLSEVLNGFMQIGIAAWLYAVTQRMYGLTWSNSWPLFVIAVGVSIVIKYFAEKPNT